MDQPVDPAGLADGPLTGLRVIDATQMLAGPICTMRLGDLGAEVIKVEPPGAGEWTRTHGFAGAYVGDDTTAYLGLNRNKKSITLNLKHPDGQATLRDLIAVADIFVQNYRVGTAERLGAGYDRLREVNERLVYCSISGYGEVGPYATRPGQDLVVQGYSGSLFSVGAEDDPPTPGALWAADTMTGYQAAVGILSALIARERTGRGQKVDVNMLAVVMDCQAQELTTYLNVGSLPTRTKAPFAHAWVTAPYGVYRTKDGWITLAQVSLTALGDALDDDRLRAMTDWDDGIRFRDEIYGIVRDVLPSRTTGAWLDVFERHSLWAGPVFTYADLASDPHVEATGMLTSVEHPIHGRLRLPAPPLRMSETPPSVRTPPPALGEHTASVLSELLDYDADRIAALRDRGAI